MTLVDRALTFIEDHIREKLLLGGVAGEIGYSPYHVSHAFAEKTGRKIVDVAFCYGYECV